MPSYHLRNGVGPAVKCSHDPCKLHGDSDFQASDDAQAQVIGEKIVESMYKGVDVDGLRRKANTADSVADRNRYMDLKNARNGINDSYKGNSDDFLDRDINNAVDNGSTGIYDSCFSIVDALDDDEVGRRVADYDGSMSSLINKTRRDNDMDDDVEPSDRDLLKQMYADRLDSNFSDNYAEMDVRTSDVGKTIRRNANAVLRGKTDLDAAYVNDERAALDAAQRRLGDSDFDEVKKEIAAHKRNIKRGSMPAAVRRRVIQNAWERASLSVKRDMIKTGNADILRYAPASDIARSLRHRPESERFQILDSLGSRDKSAMMNVIMNGGIREKDAMAWVNKHHVRDSDGNVSDTNRTVNAFLRSTYTKQGHSPYTASRSRMLMRKLGSKQALTAFTDKDGHYDSTAHAKALYALAYGTGIKSIKGRIDGGYLPLASKIISRGGVPRSTMIKFAAMSENYDEKNLASSQYEGDYAATHKDRDGNPVLMKRWHALKSVIPHVYGNVLQEGHERLAHARKLAE